MFQPTLGLVDLISSIGLFLALLFLFPLPADDLALRDAEILPEAKVDESVRDI
jgi:hypothetical protein